MLRQTVYSCLVFLFVLFVTAPARAQDAAEKIDIYLLGTFHFGSTTDTYRTDFPDLFSPQRQAELDQIATAIVEAGVSKIFVEREYTRQAEMDSLGEQYMKGPLDDTLKMRNEVYQIAYRAKKMAPSIQIVAADRKIPLPTYALEEYEAADPQSSFGGPFFKEPYTVKKELAKLSDTPLPAYYVQLNSEINRKVSQSDFVHYALSYGDHSNFVGTQFSTIWYERNLMIFTNILRNLDPATDQRILVLFGSSHTATLRHFFEDHNRFRLVELDQLLGER